MKRKKKAHQCFPPPLARSRQVKKHTKCKVRKQDSKENENELMKRMTRRERTETVEEMDQ